MNNKTIGIAVVPKTEKPLLYIDSDKLIKRLEKRIKLYKNQMLKIENEDINFLNNKAYINLNASYFQLQDIIDLIKLNMI